jgi:hypothetical protein
MMKVLCLMYQLGKVSIFFNLTSKILPHHWLLRVSPFISGEIVACGGEFRE